MASSAQPRFDEGSSSPLPTSADAAGLARRFVHHRAALIPTEPSAAFAPIRRIGGATGWYFGDWLWRLRGALDRLVGGVGMRRGRSQAEALQVGDPVDCWRVEAFEAERLLLLRAELKLPGRAWLRFELAETKDGSIIRQTAIFDAVGVLGLAYWYLSYPVHALIFAGMLRGIVRRARATTRSSTDRSDPPHSRRPERAGVDSCRP